MKTPREILFARHRSVEPKLDEIRESAVAAVCDRRTSKQTSPAVADRRYNAIAFLRELLSFKPQTWAGLAAVWAVVLVLKFSTHDGSHVVARKTSMSPEAIAQVRQQKLFFFELAGLHEARDATPPKLLFLRPRSDLRNETFAA